MAFNDDEKLSTLKKNMGLTVSQQSDDWDLVKADFADCSQKFKDKTIVFLETQRDRAADEKSYWNTQKINLTALINELKGL